ncbi:hypothetical protein ABE33_13670 [Bacillus safensis]|uniref:Immunity protein 30 domain-containing protein n=1 Tax=Bacillus safensis TaxID=561879 RepID=A0A5C0WM38_BACIA|nr:MULTISPECIES: hypothetical protein [Bacillus]MBG9819702.1 hypothetical protein [Bacillus safensis]MBG9825426.1 hypothetical protein [Bacillus safensis]MBG9835073.1 hypothetical protein [Bacillus safensis]MBG9862045.1 hypothetical protein [Bacillus safensis]MBG9900015.1 hypothetical protein [Bacillus safensis]
MFRELDNLLSADTTVDSWYDGGCLIASEILSDFSLNDWGELSNQVLNKPIEWQRKIAYCLDNECNEYELNILIDLLNTNDKELFEICIDTLRSFTIEEGMKHPQILERVNHVVATTENSLVKVIFQDFLSKMNSN